MGDGASVVLNRWTRRLAMAGALSMACASAARAAEDGWLTTSDGVRLHYLVAGPQDAQPVVFVPGWTMPAWIFDAQIAALSQRYRVLALDPRGQGQSDVPALGYGPERRGRDVGELIEQATTRPVVLVGWSLGVLDALSYLRASGDDRVAALVLIDNSIGEGPAPGARGGGERPAPSDEGREARRRAFVRSMFARDPGADDIERLTRDALRMRPEDERALLAYPVPREVWRETVRGFDGPVLYAIRPRWQVQAEALQAARPDAEVAVFARAGHALFVDEPERFNALVEDFIARRVRP